MATYLTLQEVKSHLRVDFDDDDIYINDLTNMVEELVIQEVQGQAHTHIDGTVATAATTALVGTNTNFTDFKVGDIVEVDGETQRTIASITDDENLTVTVAFSNTDDELDYTVLTGIPYLKSDGTTFPKTLKHAMLILIGHFYQHREPIMVGVSVAKIPYSFKYLLTPYKHFTIA